MEYKIVRAEAANDLEIKVKALIREGWEPIGGATSDGMCGWAQSMTRNEKEPQVLKG